MRVVQPFQIRNVETIEEHLESVIKSGGNGLLFKKLGALYLQQYSCLKITVNQEENVVVKSINPLQCTDAKYNVYHIVNNSPAIQPGKVLTVTEISTQSDGSKLAFAKNIRNDISFSNLFKNTYPYYVSSGGASRASCRSCGHQFIKNELRIKTPLLFRTFNCIRPCEINFCMNYKCVSEGERRYKSWQIQPFK